MLKYIIGITLSCVSISSFGQDTTLSLVWYNVENAFDTIDQPETQDEEYLPTSSKEWVSWKYWTKLNRISKVIRNSTGTIAPDVIGVCEIENAQVLYDLSRRPALQHMNYRVIHYESPDARGIDVGLLYNPEKITFYASEQIRVNIDSVGGRTTRDILLASANWNGDTIHIFLNHWPSRRGGQMASNSKRMQASSVLLQHVDSLRNNYPRSSIIITGDFNDGPHDASLQQLKAAGLILGMEEMSPEFGTHRYGGHWEYLDQWIWNRNLEAGTIAVDTAYVYYAESMVRESRRYPGIEPARSWSGDRFTFGYSDHLPIVLRINQRDN